MSLNFALLVICFATSTMMKTLARVTRSKFPCETSFLAKPILDAEVICVIMAYFQKSLHSHLCYYFALFLEQKKIKSDRLVGFHWSVLGKIFSQKLIFDSIGTNLLTVTPSYFS